MYHYSKQRGRATLSPKDTHLFGPQFSLQASATAVNERPNSNKQQQGILGSRDSLPIKAQELLGGQSTAKRSASSIHSDTASYGPATEGAKPGKAPLLPVERLGLQPPREPTLVTGGSLNPRSKRGSLGSGALTHDPPVCPESIPADDFERVHQMNSSRIMKPPVYLPGVSRSSSAPAGRIPLPGDRVVFAESPTTPGIPTVYRTPEERAANPDRLNLDRRRLMVCPILEGEEQLRLLNYQHNMISKIEYLNGLRRLIFLDLYDNQIEEISGLNALKSLRVLMLGKNRINRIENLDSLTKLDVLDLHGNQILKITNLGHLTELRVLNLAGNLITHVDNLCGMDALTELNLRRNHIRTVADADTLPNLQRLFLSFNEITCFEDIGCLADSQSLTEVSLDGNPLAQEASYKQTVLRNMLQLRQLDMKRITEDERRIASVMARKEEEKKKETSKMAMMKRHSAERRHSQGSVVLPRVPLKASQSVAQMSGSWVAQQERRRLAINNARRQWEVMQGSLMSRTNRIVREAMPELVANHVNNVPNDYDVNDREDTESSRSSGVNSRPPSAKSMSPRTAGSLNSRPTSAKSIQSDRDWRSEHRSTSMGVTRSASLTRGPTPDRDKISTPEESGTSHINVDYLAELEGDTLSLYGHGALDALDKNWGLAAAGAVTVINFKFIDFDDIAKHLHKIRARFPSVHTLYFNSTNITTLSQLNVLSAVRRLDHLVVEEDGNPITKFTLWRNYVLFRLAHFALKKINDAEVSASDIVNAEKFFGPLAHITTSQLPQSRLVSLLGETKRKQLLGLNDDKLRKSAEPSKPGERHTTESVGRAGLVYTSPEVLQQKTSDQKSRRDFVHSYVKGLSQEAMLVNQKRVNLRQMWPSILHDLVRGAVIDMWDSKAYMKRCMEELEKTKS